VRLGVSRRVLAAVALFAGVVWALPASAAGGPPLPSQDPFYRYSGRTPLKSIRPGAVLKTRSIHVSLGSGSTPVTAEQLLYRTTGELGEPIVTVTTVIAPEPAQPLPRVVEYLSFYDGLGSKCDPSYTLAGGDAGSATDQQAEEEELLMNFYLDHGFIVTVPDFEGTDLAWMAARQSGLASLDALRATESYLHLAVTTPIGLSGYSGGAMAADWATELAPAYAPNLHIAAAAEGGVPVDYRHMFTYINGTAVYSAAIPAMLLGLARAYHLNLNDYLSAYGKRVVASESQGCMTELFGDYPGLTMAKLMRPQYGDLLHVPVFARILAAQRMGTAATHPRAALFMAVGNADGYGDGVMSAGDVKALAHRYCSEGVPVLYQEYPGVSHEEGGAFFEPQTGAFLAARLNGAPYPTNCG
jgi:hypothetical protein